MGTTHAAAQAPLKLRTFDCLSWCTTQHSDQLRPSLSTKGSSKRLCSGAGSALCMTHVCIDVPSRFSVGLSEGYQPLLTRTFVKHSKRPQSFVICRAKGKHDKPTKEKARKEKGATPQEQVQLPLRLILLRHAKSSWDDPSLADHERRLNKRGRKAAPDVAAQIRSRGWLPDLILSSDSVRTQETLKRMGDEWPELADVPAEFLHSFYDVAAADEGPTDTPQHLEDVVVEKAGDAQSVMLVGHNMGWEQAASHFAGEYVAMKTTFAVLLESPRSTWKEAFREKWHVAAVVKPASSKAAS